MTSSFSMLLFVQVAVVVLLTNLQTTNGRYLPDGVGERGVFVNDIPKLSSSRYFPLDAGQLLPDGAMKMILVKKRPMTSVFGDMSAVSEEEYQRFVCSFCAKYTHICDPFKVCFS